MDQSDHWEPPSGELSRGKLKKKGAILCDIIDGWCTCMELLSFPIIIATKIFIGNLSAMGRDWIIKKINGPMMNRGQLPTNSYLITVALVATQVPRFSFRDKKISGLAWGSNPHTHISGLMLYQLSYQASGSKLVGMKGIQVLVLGAHYIRNLLPFMEHPWQ